MKVSSPCLPDLWHRDADFYPGGKLKPLKNSKKVQKDDDEEDMAFKEKQRAGK